MVFLYVSNTADIVKDDKTILSLSCILYPASYPEKSSILSYLILSKFS